MAAAEQKTFKIYKIICEYKTQALTIFAEPYKQWKHIKNKIHKGFYSCPPNIHMYFNHRDINKYEGEQLGKFFNDKWTIHLKIYTEDDIQNKIKSHHNYTNSSPLFLPDIDTPANGTLNKFKTVKKFKLLSKEESQTHNKLTEANSTSKMSSTFKRDAMEKNTVGYLSKKHNVNSSINLQGNVNYICSSCGKEKINSYCRNCNLWVCKSCSNMNRHKGHWKINIDLHNWEECVKWYATLSQESIETYIKWGDDYIKKYSKGDYIFDNESHQEKITDKLSVWTEKYDNIIKALEENIKTVSKGSIANTVNTYNLNSRIINSEIDNILLEVLAVYNKGKRRITYEEWRNIFNSINKQVNMWEKLNQRIMGYIINQEINDKLNRFYSRVESALDEWINDDNIFNLDEPCKIALNTIKNNEFDYKEEMDDIEELVWKDRDKIKIQRGEEEESDTSESEENKKKITNLSGLGKRTVNILFKKGDDTERKETTHRKSLIIEAPTTPDKKDEYSNSPNISKEHPKDKTDTLSDQKEEEKVSINDSNPNKNEENNDDDSMLEYGNKQKGKSSKFKNKKYKKE